MTMFSVKSAGAFLALALVLAPAPAFAQALSQGFGGFSAESQEPIQIEADALDVREAEGVAVYTGNVAVTQGEAVMRTAKLTVFYRPQGQGGDDAAAGGQSINRIKAEGEVVIRSGEQTATGQEALFELARDVITLSGDVVLTEGQNVVEGQRLVIDLKSETARVESPGSSGRVRSVFSPNRATQ